MFEKIANWFRKEENDVKLHLPTDDIEKFVLKLKDIEIGYLECKESVWYFYYSEYFKNMNSLHPIVGFPDLNKIYSNNTLWPFFQIRIPGLGQPAVKDILKSENIDINNELELLKRFGAKTIANPYRLVLM